MICDYRRINLIVFVQPRANGRYSRVGSQGGHNNTFSPEYDDPANCGEDEDQYGSQYGPYGNPYDHYGSRSSVGRRSVGELPKYELSTSSLICRNFHKMISPRHGRCPTLEKSLF